MSLVGPRPAFDREVERYGDDMRRRLLVPPGMTGLWQVSGRSDLSWDDACVSTSTTSRTGTSSKDLKILWRTGTAVMRSEGAY